MTSVTISSRGQITLSKELLDHLGLTPGDKVEVTKLPNGKLHLSAVR